MGNVGDVDADLDMTVGKFAEGDGIIEIAGGIRVDGDDEFTSEIFPADRVIGEFDGGKRFGFGEGFRGKSGGQVKFPNDGKDIDARVGGAAEALDEEAFGVGLAVFPVDQFGDHLVAGFGHGGAFGTWGGNVQIVEQAGVVGDDDKEAGCFLESADDHSGAAFEDAMDTSAEAVRFGRATTAGGGSSSAINTGDNEVAMKCCAGVFGSDVKVGGSVGRNDEGEAFRVELDGAGHEVGIAGGDVVGMSDAGNAALFFEGMEGAGNGSEGNAETFG
jgi:hypothetical protein